MKIDETTLKITKLVKSAHQNQKLMLILYELGLKAGKELANQENEDKAS